MTTSQLGRRLERVEEDLSQLKTESTKTSSTVEGMRGDLMVLFTKMDQVISGTSSVAAAKGMIPWATVAWGIGLMVSLAGLGITVLTVAAAVVLWSMNSGDAKLEQKVDYVVKLEDAREALVFERVGNLRDDLEEAKSRNADKEERLRRVEAASRTPATF